VQTLRRCGAFCTRCEFWKFSPCPFACPSVDLSVCRFVRLSSSVQMCVVLIAPNLNFHQNKASRGALIVLLYTRLNRDIWFGYFCIGEPKRETILGDNKSAHNIVIHMYVYRQFDFEAQATIAFGNLSPPSIIVICRAVCFDSIWIVVGPIKSPDGSRFFTLGSRFGVNPGDSPHLSNP